MATVEMDKLLSQTYEPLRVYRWIFGIGDILDAYTAKTFARPTRAFEEIQMDYINTKRWMAGKHTWNDIQLVLYEPIAPSAGAKVEEWLKLNYNSVDGKAGYASVYKQPITLKMLDPIGNIAQEWIIKGAWPRDINYGPLDYASSDAATIELTIRYDEALILNVLSDEAQSA